MAAGSPAVLRAQSSYPSRPIRIAVHGYGAGSNQRLHDRSDRLAQPYEHAGAKRDRRAQARCRRAHRCAICDEPARRRLHRSDHHSHGRRQLSSVAGTNPQCYASAAADFSYISTITLFPFALFVGEKSPVRTLKDLMAAARERPGKLNYGHAGTGNTLHLAIELLKSRTGIDMEPIAYKDQAQLVTDVMNGRLDMSVSTFTNFHSALVNRQARAIAVTSGERWPLNPDVPPAAGDVPDYGSRGRGWVLARSGRPAARHRQSTSSPRPSRSRSCCRKSRPGCATGGNQRPAPARPNSSTRASWPTTTNGSRSRRSSIPDPRRGLGDCGTLRVEWASGFCCYRVLACQRLCRRFHRLDAIERRLSSCGPADILGDQLRPRFKHAFCPPRYVRCHQHIVQFVEWMAGRKGRFGRAWVAVPDVEGRARYLPVDQRPIKRRLGNDLCPSHVDQE